MSRDDLQQVFSLTSDYAEASPTLYEAVRGVLQKAWDEEVENQAEYAFRSTGRSTQKTLEDLSRNARPASYHVAEMPSGMAYMIPGFEALEGVDLGDTTDYDGDAGKFQVHTVNLKNISGTTMVDIEANMYNEQYYRDAKLFVDAGLLIKDPNTGEFVPKDSQNMPDGLTEFLADTGKHFKKVPIMSIGFTDDPNIYIAKGSNGMLDIVDMRALNRRTDDLHTGIIAGLLRAMPDLPAGEDPILRLRSMAMGSTGTPGGTSR